MLNIYNNIYIIIYIEPISRDIQKSLMTMVTNDNDDNVGGDGRSPP